MCIWVIKSEKRIKYLWEFQDQITFTKQNKLDNYLATLFILLTISFCKINWFVCFIWIAYFSSSFWSYSVLLSPAKYFYLLHYLPVMALNFKSCYHKLTISLSFSLSFSSFSSCLSVYSYYYYQSTNYYSNSFYLLLLLLLHYSHLTLHWPASIHFPSL